LEKKLKTVIPFRYKKLNIIFFRIMTQVCIMRKNSTIKNTIITVVTKTNDIISIKTQGNSVKNLRGKRLVKHGVLLLGENLGNHLLQKKYNVNFNFTKGFLLFLLFIVLFKT